MRGRHPYHKLSAAEKKRYAIQKLRNEPSPPTLTCNGCGSNVRAGDVARHYMYQCTTPKN